MNHCKNRGKKIKFFLRSILVSFLISAVVFAVPACSRMKSSNVSSSTDSSSPAGAGVVSSRTPDSSAEPFSSVPGSSAAFKKTVSSSASRQAKPVISEAAKKKAKPDVRAVKHVPLAPAAKAEVKNVQPAIVSSNTYPTIRTRFGYESLASVGERNLYALIGQSVTHVSVKRNSAGNYPVTRILVPGTFSEARLRVVLEAFIDDHPEIFWLTNQYSYGYRDGSTILQVYSALSPENCTEAAGKLRNQIETILKAMPIGLGQFDREEYLFNYLVSHCSYNYAAADDQTQWEAFTSYGALADGSAVCEGYSRAMQLLCEYAGIPCSLVRGSGAGVGHMWNALEIDGLWYHLDVTWCDNTFPIYNYFNVPTSVIDLTHDIGPLVSKLTDGQVCSGNIPYNLFLPSCASSEKNYFRVKGISVTADEKSVVSALALQMKKKKTSVAFYLPEPEDFNSKVTELMSAPSYQMDRWIQAAALQSGTMPDENSLSYISDKADRGLTVQIRYR